MTKYSIRDLPIDAKRVFVRVDFNVPIKNGRITDDTRITSSLPTITHALDRGATVVLASHLGRPKGKPNPEFSLEPIVSHLSGLLGGREVLFAEDCVGDQARSVVSRANQGSKVVLLENLRFHAEEEKNDPSFSQELASHCDIYVNDAFGTAHRAHASTVGMIQHVNEKAAGFLMYQEVQNLSRLLGDVDRPYMAILGGAKVSDKIEVITNLLPKVDELLIGGNCLAQLLARRALEGGSAIGVQRVARSDVNRYGIVDIAGGQGVFPSHRVIVEAVEERPVHDFGTADFSFRRLDQGQLQVSRVMFEPVQVAGDPPLRGKDHDDVRVRKVVFTRPDEADPDGTGQTLDLRLFPQEKRPAFVRFGYTPEHPVGLCSF